MAYNNLEIRRKLVGDSDRHHRYTVFELRDAVVYRFDAICFNFQLLCSHNEDATRLLRDDVRRFQQERLLTPLVLQQRFFLDDLIFNAGSLFDYVGRLVGHTLLDPPQKLRWDKVYKWAKDAEAGRSRSAANRIHGSRAGLTIVEVDQSWVRRLYAYRSAVIHYGTERPDGAASIVWLDRTRDEHGVERTGQHRFTAEAPTDFGRKLRLTSDPSVRISTQEAASLLFNKVVDATGRVLESLETDLLALTPDVAT